MRSTALFLLLSGIVACSGGSKNPDPPPSSGGRGGTGGSGGSAGKASSNGGSAGTRTSGGTGGGAGEGGSPDDGGSAGEGPTAGTGGGAGRPSIEHSYCGEVTVDLTTGSGVPESPTEPLSEMEEEGSSCGAIRRTHRIEGFDHSGEPCVELGYGTNPPSSGTHYGIWPAYRVYETPIPRGFWVHGLEHGAVVIGYSCEDCEDEVERARDLVTALGPDPLCCTDASCTGASSRLILAPDPRLETAWAAAAWGATLVADCFEEAVFQAFVELYRGRGPEAVCSSGVDVENYR